MNTPSGQLTIKDVAVVADVTRAAVSNWRARHEDFPQPTPDSPPRRPLFDLQEILAWLKSKDLLPKGAEKKRAELALTAAANELRAAHIDPISATTLALYLLALRKQTDTGHDSSGWQQVRTAATTGDLIQALEQAPVPAGLDGATMLPWAQIRDLLADESAANLVAGIGQADSEDYAAAAETIIDAFLGLGGRGDISAFGSSTSLSSKLLATAAATTTTAGETVLDPACGIGGTLIDLNTKVGNLTLFGTDIYSAPAAIAQLHAYLVDVDATFTWADSLAHDPHLGTTFGTIVSEPPLGARIQPEVATKLVASSGLDVRVPRYSDDSFLIYVSTHLAPGGYGYVLTTVGAGFRRDMAQLRQTLVARGCVEAVIQLPAGLLSYSRVPTLLWVLRAAQDTPDTSILIADATKATSAEIEIGHWLEDMRAGRATSIPVRTLSLAELITLNGDLTPSKLLREELDSDEAAASLRASLSLLEKSVGQIQELQADDTRQLTQPPAAAQHSTLQQLIDTGAVAAHRGRHRPHADDTVRDGIEAFLVPIREKGEDPETVIAPRTSRWLQDGDVLVPTIAHLPARVFTGDGHKWVAPTGVTVLEITDSGLDPTYLAACINASFNEPADLGTTIPRRDFKHLEIPILESERQQQVLDSLTRLEKLRQAAATLDRETRAMTDAFLNVVRYGDSTR
ncbi:MULTISPECIES: HsdM family class I SAM-dependent methyltransferase [unclassified Corynebacterium]